MKFEIPSKATAALTGGFNAIAMMSLLAYCKSHPSQNQNLIIYYGNLFLGLFPIWIFVYGGPNANPDMSLLNWFRKGKRIGVPQFAIRGLVWFGSAVATIAIWTGVFGFMALVN